MAIVWLYQGLWCKLLSGCPDHAAIVRSLPPPLGTHAGVVLAAIGAAEVAIAIWMLAGRRPRAAAIAQTLLLAAMNGGGLIWGRASMADPAATVLSNLVLLALVWVLADA